MSRNILFLVAILIIISCSKPNIKPDKAIVAVDTTKAVKDTGKTGGTTPTTPNQPTVISTTFGSSSTAWIMGMQSDAQNIDNESLYHNKVATDPQGNVFVLFNFYGTLDIDPSSNVLLGSATENAWVMLVKYSAAGNLLWSKQFTTSGTANALALATDAFGNVYCSIQSYNSSVLQFGSNSYSPHIPSSTEIIKFAGSGNLVWTVEIAGSKVADMVTDSEGNIYIVGNLLFPVTFYGSTTTNSFSYPGGAEIYYWAKFNTNGEYITAKTVTVAVGNDDPVIAVDQAQNIYIGGLSATVNFKPDFPVISGDDVHSSGHFLA
jgi:hypothetical protein